MFWMVIRYNVDTTVILNMAIRKVIMLLQAKFIISKYVNLFIYCGN